MKLNFWRTDNFFEYTNPLWILMNIILTILFCLALIFRPIVKQIHNIREWYFIKYKLPKKDIEYHKTLVRNFESWTKNVKNMAEFEKRQKLAFMAYLYSKHVVESNKNEE